MVIQWCIVLISFQFTLRLVGKSPECVVTFQIFRLSEKKHTWFVEENDRHKVLLHSDGLMPRKPDGR